MGVGVRSGGFLAKREEVVFHSFSYRLWDDFWNTLFGLFLIISLLILNTSFCDILKRRWVCWLRFWSHSFLRSYLCSLFWVVFEIIYRLSLNLRFWGSVIFDVWSLWALWGCWDEMRCFGTGECIIGYWIVSHVRRDLETSQKKRMNMPLEMVRSRKGIWSFWRWKINEDRMTTTRRAVIER